METMCDWCLLCIFVFSLLCIAHIEGCSRIHDHWFLWAESLQMIQSLKRLTDWISQTTLFCRDWIRVTPDFHPMWCVWLAAGSDVTSGLCLITKIMTQEMNITLNPSYSGKQLLDHDSVFIHFVWKCCVFHVVIYEMCDDVPEQHLQSYVC